MKFLIFPNLHKDVPDEYRLIFTHLFMDILWFGVLNGSAISFITVYFARIGGTGYQIGLLGALPAIVAIVFTIPAGIWLQKGEANQKVVAASFIHRIFLSSMDPNTYPFCKFSPDRFITIYHIYHEYSRDYFAGGI